MPRPFRDSEVRELEQKIFADGSCRTGDSSMLPLFFPTETSEFDEEAVAKAKAICSSCPVQPECLEYAFKIKPQEGVWGGLHFKFGIIVDQIEE